MSKVFVTGIGAIAAIGNDVHSIFESLKEGRTGIDKMHRLQSIHAERLPVGEVKMTNDVLKEDLGLNKETDYSRTLLLALKAAKEAVADSGIQPTKTIKTGLISASSVAGMDLTETVAKDYFEGNTIDTSIVKKHPCGNSTRFLAQYFEVNGFVSTISTACSSSANAIMLGARMIKHGKLDRVIVGGADALTKFTLNGFDSLRILDSEKTRAFDDSRTGLNLGEGAGFLVLESERLVEQEGKKTYCEVVGYANANDAFHQTASSPEGNGAFYAMRDALQVAGVKETEVDYINVHGTGTENNDLSEGVAMKRLFQEALPPFSSTKPFTGHTLAAAASIEGVISCLTLEHQLIFPNLNFKTPMQELEIVPVTALQKVEGVKTILSNSFGFGGNCSSILFQKN
ncbi:beta-ketoacyl-[acyl-carrier-protein] synthase family protein [Flammeovirga aprica]|uniref:Beta-ketoacyl-[acyl-carrier-protein] synthase family protein n=1 Tax=Flammeovirga aprica JL-4 TaxID=694437 RepID=A0A7X9RSW4_9BACT|nr:beta-ketoacyl-[acyl-carrier-protein] synthase family protein [Flammeovirga aprica]NME66514.1 beta-ketoacyl-[acyl-carrier-protein] synthase family protein [Flammeovirga aprica JL-4]